MARTGHSHHRLFFAMGASSGLLAALLWILSSLIGSDDCSRSACLDKQESLIVRLENQKNRIVLPGHVPERQAQTAPPAGKTTTEQQLTDPEEYELGAKQEKVTGPAGEVAPKRDWYAIAKEHAAHTGDVRFRNEESRKSMWRQTRSVMFADTGEFDVHEAAPFVADLEFRVPVGVLGVGITIGGCFIGIPLAGIPVEKRTVGPNVIYCKDRYE